MEELTKRNGAGIWMRVIEKCIRRFNSSLEWLIGRIGVREEEIERVKRNGEMDETEKNLMLRAQRMKSVDEVLHEFEVLIDTYFFNGPKAMTKTLEKTLGFMSLATESSRGEIPLEKP